MNPPTPLVVPPALRACLITASLLLLAGVALQGSSWNRSLLLALNGGAYQLAWAASVLSVLGQGAALLIVAGLLGLRRPALPAAVLLVVLAGGLGVQLLKWLIGSARPLALLGPEQLQGIGIALHGRSMPSGHAALWAAVATLLWLAAPSTRRPRLRHVAALLLTVLAMAGALARAVVGAHWPADLLVGAGLGVATAALVLGTPRGQALVRWLAAGLLGRTGSRLLAALLVALAAALWVAERDYPAAEACCSTLCLLGLLAALGWWRLHPSPPRRWLPLARRPAGSTGR